MRGWKERRMWRRREKRKNMWGQPPPAVRPRQRAIQQQPESSLRISPPQRCHSERSEEPAVRPRSNPQPPLAKRQQPEAQPVAAPATVKPTPVPSARRFSIFSFSFSPEVPATFPAAAVVITVYPLALDVRCSKLFIAKDALSFRAKRGICCPRTLIVSSPAGAIYSTASVFLCALCGESLPLEA